MVAAVGARYADNPYFGGIEMIETANSIKTVDETRLNYTADAYATALIDMAKGTADACPGGWCFFSWNFISQNQSKIDDILDELSAYGGVIMGGPDILPNNSSLNNLAYPRYETYKDAMPIFCTAMYDSYTHSTTLGGTGDNKTDPACQGAPYYTPTEIFEFARDTLNCNIIFWQWNPNDRCFGAYNTPDDVLGPGNVLANNPTFNVESWS